MLDWERIGANALVSFATCLLALQAAGINSERGWSAALIVAILQAALAAGQEILKEKGASTGVNCPKPFLTLF